MWLTYICIDLLFWFLLKRTSHSAVRDLFSNFTWYQHEFEDGNEQAILQIWTTPVNMFAVLILFIIFRVSTVVVQLVQMMLLLHNFFLVFYIKQ